MPTGGVEIDAENLSTWFKAGVCAVGMGSKLISKNILAQKQYNVLHDLTIKALDLVKSSR